MHGWWLELEGGAAALPVRSSVDSVKCTSYVIKGKRALIVLAVRIYKGILAVNS